jgi:hypothetical protein
LPPSPSGRKIRDRHRAPPATERSLFEAPPIGEQERMVEAILFASAEPVTVADLVARMPHGSDPAEALVHLRKRYEGRGVNLVRVGDAWAMRTAPDLGFLMQKEVVETRKLSRAAIETWRSSPIISPRPGPRSRKSAASPSAAARSISFWNWNGSALVAGG